MSCKCYVNRPNKSEEFCGLSATYTIFGEEPILKDVVLRARIHTNTGDDQYWIAEDNETGELIIVSEENLENFYYWD